LRLFLFRVVGDYKHNKSEVTSFGQRRNKSGKIRLGSTYDWIIDFLKENDPTNEELLKRTKIRRHDYFDGIPTQPIAKIREKVWEPFEFMNFDKLLWAL
jgi:hypothetical protein